MAPHRRAVAFLLPATFLCAQQEVVIRSHAYTPPAAILRSETTLVEADLTVRDSQGHTIPNLHASDFQVFDDGVPQKITAFSELHSDGKLTAPASVAENIPPAEIPPPAPKYVTASAQLASSPRRRGSILASIANQWIPLTYQNEQGMTALC